MLAKRLLLLLPIAGLLAYVLLPRPESVSADMPKKNDPAFNPPPTTFECRSANGAITIDGKADEEAWNAAQSIEQFFLPWLKSPRYSKTKTKARLLWDRDYLYFFAEMEDFDLFADITEHDGKTWNNDDFEMFFKPVVDGAGYYEFHVNAAGAILDMYITRRTDGGYLTFKDADQFHVNAKVVLKGTLNKRDDKDEGWSVEGRIPWKDFEKTTAPPKVGDKWKFALCRYDYTKDEEPEISTCAPFGRTSMPKFELHEDYATLVFINIPKKDQPEAPIERAVARPFGLEKREPLTTSTVIGSPEPPPPYKIVRAFPNLKFEKPLLMARAPGSDRLYVGEELGVLYSFADKQDAKAELFLDLRKEITTIKQNPFADGIGRVYGLVFHPQFEKNRQCFVCYTLKGVDRKKRNLEEGTRVSRFTVTKTDPPRIDPKTEEIVLTFLGGGHNGGDLHFGNDGMLYISTGDGTNPNPPDEFNTGQDISDLLSSVLRIDVDRQDEGKQYAIPKDNPFVGMKNVRSEVWAYGFRNPWRMSFDRKTGELFVGDVGWELWEMIYRVEKGGNYGWSATEGPQAIKPEEVGPTPIRRALIDLSHSIACSVTGGYVYRGKKFPELQGAYIFGDWETRRMWAARFDGDRTKEMIELSRPSVRVVSFGEDKDGELYFLDYDTGTVHTFERNDAEGKNVNFPTKLSETGLFASVEKNAPAAGVVPFQVNARQWQDGATAEHFAAFPNNSSVTLYPTGKPIPGNVDWRKFRFHFPKNAVLQRNLSLGGKRVETQLLHFDGEDWRPYTYAWRDDQTDADLVPADGAEKEIKDGKRSLVWQFHSRSQCMSCHHSLAEYTLGFQPGQLNRMIADGRNQLVALSQMGLINRMDNDGKPLPPFDDASAANEPSLVDPFNEKNPLEARARAYLHANCGHCHTEHGGGITNLRLHAGIAKHADLKAVDVVPNRGDFGLHNARIIKPGDPCSSTLYYRMAKFGKDRMPHVGSEVLDEPGLKLIEEWIASMRGTKAETPINEAPEKILATTQTALIASRKIGTGEMKPPQRDQLLAAAAKLPAGPIRDLFDGYLPQEGPRKLGANPRPVSILSLKGDSARGEKLFFAQALNCASCHKVGNKGTPIGPELTSIGKQRTREDLLESILEPSKRLEPNFAAYTARHADGRTITGLIVKRDEKQVVLRDAQNKDIAIKSDDLEEMRPSRASLMPDGQMAGLTAQEAADLLEYLATRK